MEAAVDQFLHMLGVAGLAPRREADQVGEEDRDDPAFVGAGLEGGPARVAEAGAFRGQRPAGGTSHVERITVNLRLSFPGFEVEAPEAPGRDRRAKMAPWTSPASSCPSSRPCPAPAPAGGLARACTTRLRERRLRRPR